MDFINRFYVINLDTYTSVKPFIKINNKKYFVLNSYYIKKWKEEINRIKINNKFYL